MIQLFSINTSQFRHLNFFSSSQQSKLLKIPSWPPDQHPERRRLKFPLLVTSSLRQQPELPPAAAAARPAQLAQRERAEPGGQPVGLRLPQRVDRVAPAQAGRGQDAGARRRRRLPQAGEEEEGKTGPAGGTWKRSLVEQSMNEGRPEKRRFWDGETAHPLHGQLIVQLFKVTNASRRD